MSTLGMPAGVMGVMLNPAGAGAAPRSTNNKSAADLERDRSPAVVAAARQARGSGELGEIAAQQLNALTQNAKL